MSSTPQGPSGSQPPQWNNPGQQPHGQQPSYPGGQQYGQQQYGHSGGSASRPGTVTAAAIITMIFGALTGIFWLIVGLLALLSSDAIVDEANASPEALDFLDQMGFTASELDNAITRIGVVSLVIALLSFAIIPAAVAAMRGSNAGRIVVVIGAVVTLLLSVLTLAVGNVFALLWIVAAIAVIVLLFVGDAGRFFSKSR